MQIAIPIFCLKCKLFLQDHVSWFCETCKAPFCESCYITLSDYGCIEADQSKQCSTCYFLTGATYCMEDNCNCPNQPRDIRKGETVKTAKRRIRRNLLKKQYKSAGLIYFVASVSSAAAGFFGGTVTVAAFFFGFLS